MQVYKTSFIVQHMWGYDPNGDWFKVVRLEDAQQELAAVRKERDAFFDYIVKLGYAPDDALEDNQ